jgi:hypothetical protein
MAICTFNIESFFQAFFLSLGEFSFLSMTYDEAVTGIMSRVGHPTDLSQGPAISKVSTMAKIESAKKQLALIERHRKLLREIDNALAAKAADLKSSRFNARHNLIERD